MEKILESLSEPVRVSKEDKELIDAWAVLDRKFNEAFFLLDEWHSEIYQILLSKVERTQEFQNLVNLEIDPEFAEILFRIFDEV